MTDDELRSEAFIEIAGCLQRLRKARDYLTPAQCMALGEQALDLNDALTCGRVQRPPAPAAQVHHHHHLYVVGRHDRPLMIRSAR